MVWWCRGRSGVTRFYWSGGFNTEALRGVADSVVEEGIVGVRRDDGYEVRLVVVRRGWCARGGFWYLSCTADTTFGECLSTAPSCIGDGGDARMSQRWDVSKGCCA